MILDAGGVDAVFAVGELHDFAHVVANGAVVFDFQVLEALNQPTLNISGLRRVANLKTVCKTKVQSGWNGKIVHLGMVLNTDGNNFDNGVQNYIVVPIFARLVNTNKTPIESNFNSRAIQ